MRIERLELFHLSVPLPATQRLASHPGHSQPANELTFARLTTDDGIVGEAGGFTFALQSRRRRPAEPKRRIERRNQPPPARKAAFSLSPRPPY